MSSSAQLVLLPWLLGWQPPGDRTGFGAGLHAGSCLGIAWALREDLAALDRRDLAVLGASSVPAAVAGLLAADQVEARLGRPPQLAVLLAGFGALMWWVDLAAPVHRAPAAVTARPDRTPLGATSGSRRRRPVGPGSHRDTGTRTLDARATTRAAVAQALALVPGVSRSGATLTALRGAGVDRATARRFSLLMSLPVTAGAAALSLARADRDTLRELGPALAAGTLTAALSAAACATADRARPGRSVTAAALYRLGLAAVVAHRLHRQGDP